jgi:hypothetical protein
MLELQGTCEDFARQVEQFQQRGKENEHWQFGPENKRLYVAQSLWPFLDFSRFRVAVTYAEARLLPSLSYRNYFVKLPLNDSRDLYVEKARASEPLELTPTNVDRLQRLSVGARQPDLTDFANPTWERVYRFETIEEGLAPYF